MTVGRSPRWPVGRPGKPLQRQQLELWWLYIGSLAAVLLLAAAVVRAVFQQSQLATIRSALLVVSEDLSSLPLPAPGSERDLQESRRDFAASHQQVEWLVRDQPHAVARLGEVRTIGPLPLLPRGKRVLWQQGPDWIAVLRPVDATSLAGHAPGSVWLRVSEGLETTEAQLAQLDLALAAAVLLALLLSALVARGLTQRAVEPVERSLARLRQFSLDASHELRGPLAAMAANVEMGLLAADQPAEQHRRRYTAIGQAAGQMEHLVEDLLLLARQDEQRLEHAQPVDLSRLLHDQLDLNRDAITLRRQALAVDITPQLLVQGQPLLLQRLFRNLIDNAMRYTPPEGQLSVQARRRGDQVLVAVADTGIGLSREQMSQVFDRFWRASTDRSDGGTGLGLAIASQICQAHGGRILVTSQPGQGSCFEVVLPLLQGS